MDNFEDKHIDKFFKEGSEQHAFPFKESSWDKMELLIEEDSNKRPFGLYVLGFVLSLSLIGGFLFYVSKGKSEINIEKQIAIAVDDNSSSSVEKSDAKSNLTASVPDKQEIFSTSKNKAVTKVSKTNITIQETVAPLTSKISRNVGRLESTGNITDSHFSGHLNNKPVELFSAKSVQKLSKANVDIISSENHKTDLVFDHKINSLSLIDGIGLKQIAFDSQEFETPEVNYEKIKQNNSHFSFAILAGMEYSSVGIMNQLMPGHRIGAELSYQFKNRFEISSGVIYSKKQYRTEAQNYSFSQGALMQNFMPEMVHGTCNIIEIPFEFSYYLKSFDHSSVYLSLGASSFLMRNEWYDFEYEEALDDMQNLPRSWSDKGINNHLFGVGTLAIGYNKNVNKRMAVQIEPYLQLPLTGIGTGQVNLVSGGLQFRVLFKK